MPDLDQWKAYITERIQHIVMRPAMWGAGAEQEMLLVDDLERQIEEAIWKQDQ